MEPYAPGISLVSDEGSKAMLADLERELADCHAYRLHVAYDGSSDPGAPGWSYLNFGKALVPGTFVWFTAFDEPRPTKQQRATHPNGVTEVTGLVFDLPVGDLRRLSELAGANPADSMLRIGELDVWTREHAASLPARDKDFPLVAVILEAPRLDPFAGRDGAREVSFMSEPALLIRTNERSCDLLIRS